MLVVCSDVIELFTLGNLNDLLGNYHPYSPDLVSCTFGVFGTIHDEFKDCSFETEYESIEAAIHFLKSKSSIFFEKNFVLLD